MTADSYAALQVEVSAGVAVAMIDHPPINLADRVLLRDLNRFGAAAEDDDDVRVVVVGSADPEFFVAHADVGLIEALPVDDLAHRDELSVFQTIADRFRSMPKLTVAVVDGIARGGGCELALSFDLRIATE